jgi:hypothetical protein
MLSVIYVVTCKPHLLNVVMLSVVMLSVVMLSVIMLSVVMLSVVAPSALHEKDLLSQLRQIYY